MKRGFHEKTFWNDVIPEIGAQHIDRAESNTLYSLEARDNPDQLYYELSHKHVVI